MCFSLCWSVPIRGGGGEQSQAVCSTLCPQQAPDVHPGMCEETGPSFPFAVRTTSGHSLGVAGETPLDLPATGDGAIDPVATQGCPAVTGITTQGKDALELPSDRQDL